MSKKNKILLFFGVSFLAIIFTPLFGYLYEKFFGPVYGGFFWVSSSSVFEGFIFSFLFFGSLLSWLFVAQKKKKYWLSYTLPFLTFMLLLGAFEELIIGTGLVAAGWLLAQGILLIRKKSQ
ncbi:hypothetical protein KJ586_02865 [Patescibacteria group bacterium]|nr:hypothetical protein [Patescibacteria group bacterium]MBU4455426.1 hypothetical protein [Patescibacteria group bacterium]MCG2690927.1 hypothetical protein [Candidatus Parcubacteria bacterium]